MLGSWAPTSGWHASVAPPILVLGGWVLIAGRRASASRSAQGLGAYFRSACLRGAISPCTRGLGAYCRSTCIPGSTSLHAHAWGLGAYFRSACLHGSASPHARARGLGAYFRSACLHGSTSPRAHARGLGAYFGSACLRSFAYPCARAVGPASKINFFFLFDHWTDYTNRFNARELLLCSASCDALHVLRFDLLDARHPSTRYSTSLCMYGSAFAQIFFFLSTAQPLRHYDAIAASADHISSFTVMTSGSCLPTQRSGA
uniref:Uncharacterized protein n=1 Tax=Setaria viridis TaxID=4556 RepID=A0A4U6U3F9_SETVI|nr:hypothetical protein SEVIR_6G099100v2 [Setaria viridis]